MNFLLFPLEPTQYTGPRSNLYRWGEYRKESSPLSGQDIGQLEAKGSVSTAVGEPRDGVNHKAPLAIDVI